MMIASTSFVQRKLRKGNSSFSVDELGHALELTHDEQRSHEEQKILEGIVNFGNIDVKQIMTSRMDVTAVTLDTSFHDLVETIIDAGFSRIPVYRQNLDDIAGVLYVKDLLPHLHRKTFNWQGVLRSPYFIPENKKIDDQLKEFQEKKIHMAIVVDEYGGTSGLVTLEDVIEEIVGEITDEFDSEDLKYSKLDEHNYVFEGKTQLIDIYRILDIDGSPLEAAKGESDTLAGFVIEQAGKIPLKGEKITFREFTFTVDASDKRKVKRVKLTINEEKAKEANED
jgi:gliding motility-associated protein GldE